MRSQLGDPFQQLNSNKEVQQSLELKPLYVCTSAHQEEPTVRHARQASVSAYDFWSLLYVQNWSR